MIKISGLMLFLIFSGCVQNLVVERCAYSAQFDICACHDYDFWKAERVSEPRENGGEYCDDIVGYHAEDWANKITPSKKYVYKKYLKFRKSSKLKSN